MIYSTINKNCIYDFTGNPGAIIDYTIEKEGSVIYTGRAVINPNGHAVIAVNRLCADWLSNKLYNVAYTQVQETEGFGIFNLVSEGVTLEQYAFLFAADFDFNGYDKIMSDPVNGHADRRMFVFYSRYSETATPAEEEVIPANPFIRPDRETMRFAYAGGTQTLNVTASVPYTATASEPWLSINPQQGQTGTMTFMVGVQANSGMEREAYITFTGDGVEARVKIIQAHTQLIWIDPTEVTFPLNGGSRQITVNSLLGFTIGAHPSYLTFNPTAGAPGQQTVTVTCAANAGTQTREGSVNFISGDDTAALAYSQTGHYINATPSSLEFPSEGGSRTIAVESTASWTASSIQSFLTMSPQQGNSGTTMVTLTCAENEGATRGGGITLTNAAGAQCTISHNQASPHPPVPFNKIMYTTTDGLAVTIKNTTGWTNADGEAVTIVSNTYINGQGWIEFSDDIANIPDNAFWLNLSDDGRLNTLETLIMPDCIQHIGIRAFCANEGLVLVTVPNTVTSIGEAAFMNTAISSIYIPYGITRIEKSTFLHCRYLPEIILPDTVTYIDEYAFGDCSAITTFTVPNTVTYIGPNAFNGCSLLAEVNIPNGIAAILNGTFGGCTALTGISIPSTVTSIGQGAFASSGIVSISIPQNVAEIPYQCFAYCHSLTGITMGDITNIGERAFQECTALSSITLPSTVRNIDRYAFMDASALAQINAYSVQAPYLVSGQYVFYNISSTGTLHYPQGSNYSTWIAALPSGWTAVADL